MTAAFDITAVPAFRDNYIWLLHAAGRAVAVDPGDAAPVRAALAAHGLALTAVLVTHHHADHQGGVAALCAAHPGIPVYGPAAESITGLTHPLAGGETIGLPLPGAPALRVLAVPGHTLGHLAYVGDGVLFCGDTLFGAGCGRLFEGSAAQMAASLATLAALPGDTRVYCAHEYTEANLRFAQAVEPGSAALAARAAAVAALRARGAPTVPSTLAEERATNPFLRVEDPVVQAAAVAAEPERYRQEGAFAALRAWKDRFR